MKPRHLLIRHLTPLVWRLSEKRKLRALQEFSDIELDSGWQSLNTLAHVDDPRAKAELFMHSLEEFYHAEMFANLLHSYSSAPLNRPVFTRVAILAKDRDRPAALLEFLVQVYVGEREINSDFLVYAKSRVDEPIRSLFNRIKSDEQGHEDASWRLMVQHAAGREYLVRWLVFRKTAAHIYRRYVKFSQALGHAMLNVWLGLIYFVVALFFVRPLRTRLALSRTQQLDILRAQIRAVAIADKGNA